MTFVRLHMACIWKRLVIGLAGIGLVLFSSAGFVQAGLNQWTTNGPAGLVVQALVINPKIPKIIYAGTNGGGVFRSTDGGETWNAMNTGLTDLRVNALAIAPWISKILYAGTEGGVFRSIDGGVNWSKAGLDNEYVNTLAIAPTIPATLYAGTLESGVLKSTNWGVSWRAVNNGLTNKFINALTVYPKTPTTIYAGTNGNSVFKSTDGGASWNSTGLTSPFVNTLAIDPKTPTTLYAGTEGGGVFKSTDGGATWNAMSSGLESLIINTLAIDPKNPATLYAGTEGGGVFKSTDGGANWNAMNEGLTNLSVKSLAMDPKTVRTIYAGTNDGAFDFEVSIPCVAGTITAGTIYDSDRWLVDLFSISNLVDCTGLSDALTNLDSKTVHVEVGPFSVDIPGDRFVLKKTWTPYYEYSKRPTWQQRGTQLYKLFPESESILLYAVNADLDGISNPITVRVQIDGFCCESTVDWSVKHSPLGSLFWTN